MTTNTETQTPETHSFQAEVAAAAAPDGALGLLRERHLPARADLERLGCLDKLRYEAIAKPELMATAHRSRSASRPTTTAGTLTIADTGIGMDRQELIDNLGTIARSGTRAFLEPARRGQGRRRPDRPVRRRLLLRLHGRRPHRGDEPPRGRRRSLGLALHGRRRASRWRRQAEEQARARAARHRGRAAPEGRRQAVSRGARDRAHRAHLLRPHPVSDRACRRQGRRAAPDQCRKRALAAVRSPSSSPRTTRRPTAPSPAPSTSRP